MRPAVRSAIAAFLAASLVAVAANAGDPASGEAHFKKGKDLLARGETVAACAELELAEAADPTVGTLGLLAGCHEQLGKLATAHDEYVATEARARTTADPRGEFAKKQATRLEPKVPRVRVAGVDPPPAGLVVTVDKKEIPLEKLRAALLVDPGTHQLEARADGRPPFSTTFEASAGVEGRVTIAFASGPAAEVAPPPPASSGPADEPASPRAWSRPLGIALLGIGGASLVVGGITGAIAIGKKSASQPCNGAPDCKGTRDAAYTFAGISTATVIGGLVAAGAGVVFVITAPKSPATTGLGKTLDLRATAAPGGGAAALHATF